jgi:hypothetical protein
VLIGGGMASDVCKTGGPTLKGLPGGPMVIGDPLDVVRTGGETLLLVLLLFLIVLRIFLGGKLVLLCGGGPFGDIFCLDLGLGRKDVVVVVGLEVVVIIELVVAGRRVGGALEI